MPLVVPGVTNQSGDPTEHWTNKLVGKKLHDEHSNETVSNKHMCARRNGVLFFADR